MGMGMGQNMSKPIMTIIDHMTGRISIHQPAIGRVHPGTRLLTPSHMANSNYLHADNENLQLQISVFQTHVRFSTHFGWKYPDEPWTILGSIWLPNLSQLLCPGMSEGSCTMMTSQHPRETTKARATLWKVRTQRPEPRGPFWSVFIDVLWANIVYLYIIIYYTIYKYTDIYIYSIYWYIYIYILYMFETMELFHEDGVE